MADRSLFRRILDAVTGRDFHQERLDELEERAARNLNNLVGFLRQIPLDDARKKQELAKYFQSASGLRFTRSERKDAYDNLLGPERNRKSIG